MPNTRINSREIAYNPLVSRALGAAGQLGLMRQAP